MFPEEIYALTPKGEAELRGGATRLSAAEINVLVRLDGVLNVGQLSAGMKPAESGGFLEALRTLRERRLVQRVELDPFTLQWNANVKQLTRAAGKGEAEAGLASLQRSGFFVEIARERPAPVARRPGEALNVVVVEDDPQLASFTSTLLSLSGFAVRQAGNREQVVNEIRRPPRPDLILLDVVLPDADGFDILMRVRQHPVLKNVPVIMLTGKATRQAVLKGIEAGADGYITKPFEPHALLRAVRTVLGLPDEPQAERGKGPDSFF
jgi:two-component system, OmpR family, response regulator